MRVQATPVRKKWNNKEPLTHTHTEQIAQSEIKAHAWFVTVIPYSIGFQSTIVSNNNKKKLKLWPQAINLLLML